MYLSKIPINMTRRSAVNVISNAYKTHAMVAGSFIDPSTTDDGRVLWDVRHERDGGMSLYVSSPERPDLTGMVEQVGFVGIEGGGASTISYDEFLSQIENGRKYRFALVANPTFGGLGWKGTDGHFSHVTATQQMFWLAGARIAGDDVNRIEGMRGSGKRRDLANGFSILKADGELACSIVARDRVSLGSSNHKKSIPVSRVRFEGLCEVTDADALRRAVRFGIGKSKAFGCGMLMLAPVS